MIKNDKWITKMATEHGMISPFVPELVREVKVSHQPPNKVISFGLSSYGYDIRLSPKEFRVFSDPGQLIDPKDFKPSPSKVRLTKQSKVCFECS
jgi:dCTP deaminase